MSLTDTSCRVPCPAPKCTSEIPDGRFCCQRCWYSLPQTIRKRIVEAAMLYRADENQIAALVKAKDRAFAYWRR